MNSHATISPPKPVNKERITFGNQNSTFFTELKDEVKKYFDHKKIERTGNGSLYFKAIFFVTTYIAGYFYLILGSPSAWVAIGVCSYLGIAAAALGFNVMHDGAHGSFSSKKWINTLTSHSINLLGSDAMIWRNKHNIVHHTFTNIEGFDQDIAQVPVLRLNSFQKKHWFHNYQHIYCFAVYSLATILWMFALDFHKYFRRKVGNIRIPSITVQEHIVFWITKIAYAVVYLVIPATIWGWPATVLGFFVYHAFLGIILSVVFQLAHVVEETEFPHEHFDSNKIEDEWAVHQLKTTANFATNNHFINWYVGGLNFQVEHHLFPKISHVHYPQLNKIIKKVAAEYDVPYNEFPTFMSALKSHVNHLKQTASAS